MDEAAVEADSSLEESFVTELGGDGVGIVGTSFVNEIEGAIFGVPRLRSSAADFVVGRTTISRSD